MKATENIFAKCLKCEIQFHDTEDARRTGVWCPHVSLVYNKKGKGWQQERGEKENVVWFP